VVVGVTMGAQVCVCVYMNVYICLDMCVSGVAVTVAVAIGCYAHRPQSAVRSPRCDHSASRVASGGIDSMLDVAVWSSRPWATRVGARRIHRQRQRRRQSSVEGGGADREDQDVCVCVCVTVCPACGSIYVVRVCWRRLVWLLLGVRHCVL
jgi:hypothetical protein